MRTNSGDSRQHQKCPVCCAQRMKVGSLGFSVHIRDSCCLQIQTETIHARTFGKTTGFVESWQSVGRSRRSPSAALRRQRLRAHSDRFFAIRRPHGDVRLDRARRKRRAIGCRSNSPRPQTCCSCDQVNEPPLPTRDYQGGEIPRASTTCETASESHAASTFSMNRIGLVPVRGSTQLQNTVKAL